MLEELQTGLTEISDRSAVVGISKCDNGHFLIDTCSSIASDSVRFAATVAIIAFLCLLVPEPRAVAGVAQRDDEKCVAGLETVKTRFERNEQGNITGVTLGGRTTDAVLANLKGLPYLKRLALICAWQVTDDGIAHLENLTGLQSLWFGYSNITDQALVHLRGLTNLQELFVGINRSHFRSKGLIHLRGLKKLRKLTFKRTEVTQQALNDLEKYLPECKMKISPKRKR